MQRTVVLNVVGLTTRLIGVHTPHIEAFTKRSTQAFIRPVLPALTCSAQSTYLTGTLPEEHGAVANGWYDRDYREHRFWKQSNSLVKGEKLWESLQRAVPGFTCAKLFWWYNMYSSVDFSITPRPLYPADGRKVFDVHTQPMSLREEIKSELGPFPFLYFWGPNSGIPSTQWIANSAKWVENKNSPDLSLVYLPHLDYDLQRFGLDFSKISKALGEIDGVVGDLVQFFEGRGVKVILLSEYGITNVDRPIHLNRLFREKGWLSIKNELGTETLEQGECRVHAIADHQIAHVYVQDVSLKDQVLEMLKSTPGVAQVLDEAGKKEMGIHHERSGDFVVVADNQSWFTYYYWNDDHVAPDFARCVDIHRKCGYDPVELFLDENIKFPKLKIIWKLIKKKLGFRILMDVIPLKAEIVKGSHGRIPENLEDWPVLIGDFSSDLAKCEIDPTEVFHRLREHCLRS